MPYKNYKDKIAHNRRYYKGWYLENGRKRNPDYLLVIKEWIKNHKTERSASNILRYAIKIGKIKKPKTCSKCKRETKISGHHTNYLYPLRVVWVCSSCHKKIHSKLDLDRLA